MWIHFFIGFIPSPSTFNLQPSSSWKCPTSHGSHAVEAAAAWAKPGAQARQICVRPSPGHVSGPHLSLHINDPSFLWSAMTYMIYSHNKSMRYWDALQRIKERPGLRNFYGSYSPYDGQMNQSGRGSWETKTEAHLTPFDVCGASWFASPLQDSRLKNGCNRTMPRDHHEGCPKRYQKHMSCTPNPESPQIARWQRCPTGMAKAEGATGSQGKNWQGLEDLSFLLKMMSWDFRLRS